MHFEDLERRVAVLEDELLNRANKSTICEGKQVGTIYHVCTIDQLLYNLETDSIVAGEHSNNLTYVNGAMLKTVIFNADNARDPLMQNRYALGKRDAVASKAFYGKRPEKGDDDFDDFYHGSTYMGNKHPRVIDKYDDSYNDDIEKNAKKIPCVSFTRNKRYRVGHPDSKKHYIFQMVIDGDKLSNNYKVIPYDFYQGNYDRTYGNSRHYENEAEVLVPSPIKNISKYIIGINVLDNDVNLTSKDSSVECSKVDLNKFIKAVTSRGINVSDSTKESMANLYKNYQNNRYKPIDQKFLDKIKSL